MKKNSSFLKFTIIVALVTFTGLSKPTVALAAYASIDDFECDPDAFAAQERWENCTGACSGLESPYRSSCRSYCLERYAARLNCLLQ